MAVTDWAARVAQLEDMLTSGVTRASYDGQTIEYQSMADLQRALKHARQMQAGATAATVRPAFRASVGVYHG